MVKKQKILLIDQHQEWLDFAETVLGKDYEVITLTQTKNITFPEKIKEVNGFDLIFLGLELATQNLDALRPLFKRWNFVVIFPVLQENDTMRLLFKAGVYDCAPKPYEQEGLRKLVAEELDLAKKSNDYHENTMRTREETMDQLASLLGLEEK